MINKAWEYYYVRPNYKKYRIICKRNSDRGQSLAIQDSLGLHLIRYSSIIYLYSLLFYIYSWVLFILLQDHVDDENTHADHLIWKCLFNFTL